MKCIMKKKWLPERVLQPQALSNRNVLSLIVEVWACQYLNSKLWAGSTEAGIDSWKHWLKFILRLETLGTTEKPALWEWMAPQDV